MSFVYDPAADSWTEGPDLPGAGPPLGARQRRRRRSGWSAGMRERLRCADRRRVAARPEAAADDGSPTRRCPSRAAAGAAAWDGSRIVYAGGVGPDGVSGAVFAFEDGAWSQVARLAKPREHLAATSDGEGAVFVVGGRVGGLDANLATADLVEGARQRRSASCRRRAAASQRSGGRPSVRASSAGNHLAARTRRWNASTRTATCRVLPGARRSRATGSARRSSTAWRTSLLGGDQPGLFVSPTVESLELP